MINSEPQKELGALSVIQSGGTPIRSCKSYWHGDIPWYSSGELNDKYTTDPKDCITNIGLKGSSAKVFPKGSLLIGMYDTAALKMSILDRDGAFNQAIAGMKPSPGIDLKYIMYAIERKRHEILLLRRGVRQKNLNLKKVKKICIPVPMLPMQKLIVAILDEAFAAIDTATANTEKNLANARELFGSHLHLIFNQKISDPNWLKDESSATEICEPLGDSNLMSTARGRAPTDRVIPGKLSLSVGKPEDSQRSQWKWSKLSEIARLESGHTPSRRHSEYWDGLIPWIGIKDAKNNHESVIFDTLQHTNQLGLDNSSARLLPKDTVCLSRTASVGYVVVMGKDMATSQDFVNWVCSSKLNPHFLKYLFLAEGDGFTAYSKGAIHQTIYFPEVKAFHVCHPPVNVQNRIVDYLDKAKTSRDRLVQIQTRKLTLLTELRQSLLHKAFTGELTANPKEADRALSEAGI